MQSGLSHLTKEENQIILHIFPLALYSHIIDIHRVPENSYPSV